MALAKVGRPPQERTSGVEFGTSASGHVLPSCFRVVPRPEIETTAHEERDLRKICCYLPRRCAIS
jgi:hypothetical protein